jgi:hypothetical protein
MQLFKEVGQIPYNDGMSWKHRFRLDVPDALPGSLQNDIKDNFEKMVDDWFEKNPDASSAEVLQMSEASGNMLLEKMQDYIAEQTGQPRPDKLVQSPFEETKPENEKTVELELS